MQQLALKYFKEWYSCSESIVMAAAEKGYVPQEYVKLATPFSGGMASGCLCGAIAASQLVIGACFEKDVAKLMAKEFIQKFKARHKATCCRVLSHGLDKGSPERRELCKNYVHDCAVLVEEILEGRVYV